MTNLRKYIAFLIFPLLFTHCNQTLSVTEATSENIPVDATVPLSADLELTIKPYRDSMKAKMDEVLNYTHVDLEVGVPEGLLGNFVADLTYQTAKQKSSKTPDFALLNNGGLRTSIPKGAITRGKIFELMPFENEIVIVEISGDKMKELIEFVREKSLEAPSRKAGVPVSNFRMMMAGGKVNNVLINNKEFNSERSYRVVTSDYLSNGGDHMDFFLNPISVEKTGVKLRDAIIDYLIDLKKRNLEINLALDGRIYNAE